MYSYTVIKIVVISPMPDANLTFLDISCISSLTSTNIQHLVLANKSVRGVNVTEKRWLAV